MSDGVYPSDLQAWEHQPGESPRDYHVFELFCHLGWERSVRKAVEKWYAETNHPLPKNPTYRFNNVAVRWRWQERADAYWVAERRRAEWLLNERRDRIAEDFMVLGLKTLEKYKKAYSSMEPHKNGKAYIEGLSKLKDLLLGDAEERARRGRPSEHEGALPTIDDRLKPPEEGRDGHSQDE